jgi:hypothetical protein
MVFRVALVALALAIPGSVLADAGVACWSRVADGHTVTAFASPVPVRAGPAELSVLVQSRDGQPVLDAAVDFLLVCRSSGGEEFRGSCCPADNDRMREIEMAARRDGGHNRFLYTALPLIRLSGDWHWVVKVRRHGQTFEASGPLAVQPPAPPVLTYWPAFLVVPVAIGLFAAHQRLIARHG